MDILSAAAQAVSAPVTQRFEIRAGSDSRVQPIGDVRNADLSGAMPSKNA